MKANTKFAPAERAATGEIERDAHLLAETGLVDHITNVLPSILMVLNKERQIVYANNRLQELLNAAPDHLILGLRPGEILDCIHSHERAGGCGTTEFCSECGAVKAILKSQKEKVGVEAECRISTESGDAMELKIWASPYQHGDKEFTILTILDIRHEKRRQALEQTFFHDMTNVLTAISGHSRLLEMPHTEAEATESIEAIRLASKELTAEIWCHRKLLQAENGELEVEPTSGIHSLSLVNELARLCSERTIAITPDSEAFDLTSDRTLLFRVLFNMVKNATDATPEGDTVTIRCRRENDTGIFSVHNPGCMSRAVQLQVFQRSFTTKGKGHGIGTYSMRLFGEKYLKGKVGFTTSEHNGTTFYIALPLEY